MKTIRKLITIVIVICLTCAVFSPVAEAASTKKTVYVVTGIKCKQSGKTTTGKISYNKEGFITKTTIKYPYAKETQKLTYDDNHQLTQYVHMKYYYDKNRGVSEKNRKYKWKNGALWKETDGLYGLSSRVYKCNSKKCPVSCKDSDGEYSYFIKYKYKKGRVVRVEIEDDNGYIYPNLYSYDAKGNIISTPTETHNIEYGGGGRIKKSVISSYEGTWTMTYTYKKIKVNEAYAKAIEEQQWNLVNNMEVSAFPY